MFNLKRQIQEVRNYIQPILIERLEKDILDTSEAVSWFVLKYSVTN